MAKWHSRVAILFAVAGMLMAALALDFYSFTREPLPVPEDGLVYELKPGTPLVTLADDMAAAGYLHHPRYLRVLGHIKGVTRSLQAGEYLLHQGINPSELLDLLASGRSIEYSLTIVEGWTFRQVLDAISEHEGLSHTLAGLNTAEIMERLGHPDEHPEGRFYPDTYHFRSGASDVTILKRAYERLQAILDKQWSMKQKELPLESPYEALILASIVEKETGEPSERKEIAGVFVNRLRKGMRLQTDPTVIYGMGERYQGNIRRADLSSDNPYNTYVNDGLPPTPICMPGERAINAVMQPADTDYLYFVSKGDGTHYFSRSLEEHNIAVRRFQLNMR